MPARPTRVVIVGGSFSGNKGAASMLQAVVDVLPEVAGPCRFAVLSPYPSDDADQRGPGPLTIVPWRPVDMILAAVLLPVLWLGTRLGLRRLVGAALPGTRALASADVVVDVSGICFVDGRPFAVLVYNVLQVLIPKALGAPLVKAAQATGPHQTQPNRLLAKALLPRVDRLYARGQETAAHLDALGIAHDDAADLAFLLDPPPAAAAIVDRILQPAGRRAMLIVVPSVVVRNYCSGAGIDYVTAMARLIDDLGERLDATVVLVPHARRDGSSSESRMDDLPVTRAIAAAVPDQDRLTVIEELVDPHVLREILSRGRVVLSGRFHAMVSALATSTPVVVTGWSHKYAEVLEAFGQASSAIPYEHVADEALADAVVKAWDDHDHIRDQIATALPEVRRQARRSLEGIADVLSTQVGPPR